jgi:hypothetical protein
MFWQEQAFILPHNPLCAETGADVGKAARVLSAANGEAMICSSFDHTQQHTACLLRYGRPNAYGKLV